MENNKQAIRSLYSKNSLDEIALWAKKFPKTKSGDLEFSAYQRMVLEGYFEGIVFDFLTTSTVSCDAAFAPDSVDVLCLDVDDALANGYEYVADHDEMSPLSYLNFGKAIYSEELRPYEEWKDHPFFKLHCQYFEIAKAVTISFRHPEKYLTFLAFEYLASTDNQSWGNLDHSRLELASFPFALAWLYRRDLMDDARLERRFLTLQNLTEKQLTYVRKYVNSPLQSLTQQSDDLSISAPWLKESLYTVRNSLADRLGLHEPNGGRAPRSSLRLVEHEYEFFKILGDPTSQLIQPVGL